MRMLVFGAVLFTVALLAAGYHFRQTPTADELYGCTIKQQMPNGDCP